MITNTEIIAIAQHKFLEIYCNYSHEEARKLSEQFIEILLQEIQIQALIKKVEKEHSQECCK